jgi:hypothetical protein
MVIHQQDEVVRQVIVRGLVKTVRTPMKPVVARYGGSYKSLWKRRAPKRMPRHAPWQKPSNAISSGFLRESSPSRSPTNSSKRLGLSRPR